MSTTSELLDSHDGRPDPAGRRRTPWVVGGAVVAVAALGAGAWAVWSFFAAGEQPAQALPSTTIAYASIDLDPSGGQKIEALRTMRALPAFRDQVDLETQDDVRRWVFEQMQDSGTCPDLSYADDVEPWLGDRMAMAAVDTGADEPVPVIVLQVTDADAADAGLAALGECVEEDLAWSIEDGWALLGEQQDVVDDIATEAAEEPLAADADYQQWTDEAGGEGIATAYVSARAGELLADQIDDGLAVPGGSGPAQTDAVDTLESFGGMAATLRFSDGALELEMAVEGGRAQASVGDGTAGDDMVATLPDDTAMAIGIGFTQGWLGDLMDARALRSLSRLTGLDLPEDADTLVGESVALAVGGDLDPGMLETSEDGSDLPIGLRITGDADAIGAVMDRMGGPFGVDSDGDLVAVGPDPAYRAQLLEQGTLGETDAFQRAVPDAEGAAMVMFVGFDAGSWVDQMEDVDPEVADNLAALEAVGMSAHTADGTSHVLLRVTTD